MRHRLKRMRKGRRMRRRHGSLHPPMAMTHRGKRDVVDKQEFIPHVAERCERIVELIAETSGRGRRLSLKNRRGCCRSRRSSEKNRTRAPDGGRDVRRADGRGGATSCCPLSSTGNEDASNGAKKFVSRLGSESPSTASPAKDEAGGAAGAAGVAGGIAGPNDEGGNSSMLRVRRCSRVVEVVVAFGFVAEREFFRPRRIVVGRGWSGVGRAAAGQSG